jgi:hypothetical protein
MTTGKMSKHPRGMPIIITRMLALSEQAWGDQWHSASINVCLKRAMYSGVVETRFYFAAVAVDSASAILGVLAHILIDPSLRHARAALGGAHWLGLRVQCHHSRCQPARSRTPEKHNIRYHAWPGFNPSNIVNPDSILECSVVYSTKASRTGLAA